MNLRSYLFGGNLRQVVYKGLDASTLRMRAVSQNIANVTTPGYERKEVVFEEKLREALNKKISGDQTHNQHMNTGRNRALQDLKAKVITPNDPTRPGEINNVDIDMESAKLAEAQIQYEFYLKFAGFGKLKSAISGQVSN